MLVWGAQVMATFGARVASPRPVRVSSAALGLALACAAAFVTFGLTIHGCDEGAPAFGWLVSSALLFVVVAGVQRAGWRVGLGLAHVLLGALVTLALAEAVHGETWSGRADRGAAEWHTPVTGLYRRFPSDAALSAALVDRLMAVPASDPCEAARQLALAAAAEPDEPAWRMSPGDGGGCRAEPVSGPPPTSAQVRADLLASAEQIAALDGRGDFWVELVFLGQVEETARWLAPADACALAAALPPDHGTWSRAIAVDVLAGNLSPAAHAACAPELRDAGLGPDEVRERLFQPGDLDVEARWAALAAFVASDATPQARVATLAAARRHAGALGDEVDRAILSAVDGEGDADRRRSLAAVGLVELGR